MPGAPFVMSKRAVEAVGNLDPRDSDIVVPTYPKTGKYTPSTKEPIKSSFETWATTNKCA